MNVMEMTEEQMQAEGMRMQIKGKAMVENALADWNNYIEEKKTAEEHITLMDKYILRSVKKQKPFIEAFFNLPEDASCDKYLKASKDMLNAGRYITVLYYYMKIKYSIVGLFKGRTK